MRLLVQPGDGVGPIVKAITGSKKNVEIVIFRFDEVEVEKALAKAVSRGVSVRALIAHTNRAGEVNLRKLEMRLLAAGVTVARTADDLVRYHGKLMIIDHTELYLLAFNLTVLDIERSRSFGIVTRDKEVVAEAVKLFEADTQRASYESGCDSLVVSPVNARKRLGALIKSAKKELLIYDLKVSDPSIIRLLDERTKAGVVVKIIGRMTHKLSGVETRKLSPMRLHTRTILVDGKEAFVGSQSLREAELDARREVGIVFDDSKIVSALVKVFENDWEQSQSSSEATTSDAKPVEKAAKKVAKAVTRQLPDVLPVLNGAVSDAVGGELSLKAADVEDIVKNAVKEAVVEALSSVVGDAVEQSGGASREATK